MVKPQWTKVAGKRLRWAREQIAGKRGRTAFGRPVDVPHTTLLEWEEANVTPDWQKLCYLLSWWSVRLGWVLDERGPVIQEHKLYDAVSLLAPEIRLQSVRAYLAALLRGCRDRGLRYRPYIDALEDAEDRDLATVIARTALLVVADLLCDPPKQAAKPGEYDYDAFQLAMTQAESHLRVAEGLAPYNA